MLGVKLSAEPKTVYPNNHKMPNVSDFNVFSCHFEHGKTRHLWFLVFYLIIYYTASASKYLFQNENVLFLTEVILV